MPSMEELVLAEEYIVEIVPGEDWDFPEIDYQVRFPNSSGNVEMVIEEIKNMLNTKYIIDDFTKHWDRTTWKLNFEIEHGEEATEYLNWNSLRGNWLYGIKNGLFIFSVWAEDNLREGDRTRIQSINQRISDMQPHYGELVKPSVEIIKGLKQEVYEFLTYLAKEE